MAVLADGSAESLHPFVTGAADPGATVITDAWTGYHGLAGLGYAHERRSQRAARARGDDPGELLPAVHRVASLAKRWLPGTHQGSAGEAHLPACLDEFVFRFNRRRSSSLGEQGEPAFARAVQDRWRALRVRVLMSGSWPPGAV